MADELKYQISEDPEALIHTLGVTPQKASAYGSAGDIPFQAYLTRGKDVGMRADYPIGNGSLYANVERSPEGITSSRLGGHKNIGNVNISADVIRRAMADATQNAIRARADMPVGESGRAYLQADKSASGSSYGGGLNTPFMGGQLTAGASRRIPVYGTPDTRLNVEYRREFAKGGQVNKPPMEAAARALAAQGRYGDSTLVHVNPKELAGLASLSGRQLTRNPHTGMPEAFNLSDMLPAAAALAANYFIPGAGPLVSGLAAGATKYLQTGNLEQGVLSGLLAGGTSGIADSLAEAGANAPIPTETTAKTADVFSTGAVDSTTQAGPLAQSNLQTLQNMGVDIGQPSMAGQSSMVNDLRLPTSTASVSPVQGTVGANPYDIDMASPNVKPYSPADKLDRILTGAQQKGALENAFYSKSGLAAGIGALGMLQPKPTVPAQYVPSSNYKPLAAYDRNVSFAPQGYDPRTGEWNYFPGDRYARAAAGGMTNDIVEKNMSTQGNYPLSEIKLPNYASYRTQMPTQQNVVGDYDATINPFTGQENFASGGIAGFDRNTGLSRIRELRRTYANRATAERAANQKNSIAQRLGVTSAEDPILTYAFGPKQELEGRGDGMSDEIKASIGGHTEARLSDGEFVVPADVVSGLGNGSTKAGAEHLYSMLDRVRQARTGTKKQAKEIKAGGMMPA